jgi:hypothetical protein
MSSTHPSRIALKLCDGTAAIYAAIFSATTIACQYGITLHGLCSRVVPRLPNSPLN